jgi:tripartite-type tricarboxylate transporter receptor subunit TctC
LWVSSKGATRDRRAGIAGVVIIAATLCSPEIASSQHYPSRPIRIIAAPPGGNGDFTARLIAPALAESLGQPVIVENRPTAAVAEIASRAPADGYSLLINASVLWLAPFMKDNLAYDPIRDFAPITLAVKSPHLLVVNPALPVTSVQELIALAKAQPGKLNYAASGSGTSVHLSAELFNAMAGVRTVYIAYKGSGPAFNDVISGQIQFMFPVAAAGMPHVKSGRLRALAVTSLKPTELAPGLNTLASSGLAGYESESILGMFTRAGTPPTVITRLNQEMVRLLRTAEVKERFLHAGVESVGSSPAEFAITIKSEMSRMGRLIKAAGIRAD